MALAKIKVKPGYRFGKCIAIEAVKRKGNRLWLFRCSVCGEETTAQPCDIVRTETIGCKCYRMRLRQNAITNGKDVELRNIIKHGHTRNGKWSREYNSWIGMKHRCYNPNSTGYENYGGIGIGVCERWLKFENFLADMGPRPPETSLDRINCNRDYEPGNCRWADKWTQATNKWSPII